MAKRDNPVHVLINNPADVRRHLLLGAVDAIKALERYEHFKKLKSLKKKKFLLLNEKIKHIEQEVQRLLETLPKVTEEKVEKQIVRMEVKKEYPEEKVNKKDKASSDLKREIRTIQEKLQRLNF